MNTTSSQTDKKTPHTHMPETEQPQQQQQWPAVDRCDALFAQVGGGDRAYGGISGGVRTSRFLKDRTSPRKTNGVMKKT